MLLRKEQCFLVGLPLFQAHGDCGRVSENIDKWVRSVRGLIDTCHTRGMGGLDQGEGAQDNCKGDSLDSSILQYVCDECVYHTQAGKMPQFLIYGP